MDPGSLDSMGKNFNESFPPEDNNEFGDSDVEIYNFKMDDDDSDDSTISCSLIIEDKKLAEDIKKIVTDIDNDIDDENHSLSVNHSEESDIKVYIHSVEAFQKHWLDIQLVWEDIMHQCTVNGKNLPTSYTNLTSMEKLVLLHASNFIQQFKVKYPNRRQMALVFKNECGIQKCVCTAIKPSRLDYPNLNDLSSYSEFVANHITYTKLEDPTIMPKKMVSPTATLEMQTANCFELATLLESFLIGTGYNAFIVQGYATESVCNNDVTKVKLDLPKDNFNDDQESESDSDSLEELISKGRAEIDHYTPEPMLDLSNAYVNLLLEEENENVVQNKVKEDNLNKNFDSLFGKRVHCWIMLLPPEINDRNTIEVPYFIEPSTGERKDINDQNYIAIEAIWNHKNYWVNLQSSNGGCKDYDYTIMNTNCWEHFLPDNGQIHPYMPISWVNILEVPYNKYVMLYPTGKKVMHYMNALKEFFAEYIMPDGLIQRTTYYAEPDYKSKTFVQEVYKHRADSLIGIEITINETTKGTETVEYFRRGRKDCLKLHKFCGDSDRMDTDRLVTFYKSRVDSLIELMVYEKKIIETSFEDRPDFLFWRTCVLEDFKKNNENIPIFHRKPAYIIEKYLRDESKPKDRDIYTIQFDYATDDVFVKYQYGEGQITQSSRLFKYSATTFDKFNPAEAVIENIVYPYTDNLKPHEAYLMSKEMLEAKNEAFRVALTLQDNIKQMLEIRSRERLNFKLIINSLDWDRNYKIRQILQNKKDLLIAIAKREKSEQISDHPLPYFITTKTITYDFALNVRNKIMNDFRKITNTKFKRIQNAFNNKKYKFKSLTKALAESEKFNDVKIKHKALIMCATLKSELDVLMLKITRYKETRIQRYNNLASNLNNNENFITLPPLKLYTDI